MFCVSLHFFSPKFIYLILDNTYYRSGGGGYSWEFFVGVCCPVPQILNVFHTKECSSLENHTRFQAKMGIVYTRFQTKTAQKTYPMGRQISLYEEVPPPPRGDYQTTSYIIESLGLKVMTQVKFRRICMESSEHNWANISEKICPTMLVFDNKASLVFSGFQNILTNPIISQI